MIVNEIVSIFETLIHDISKYDVLTSLTGLQNHISNRTPQNTPSVMQQSASVRSRYLQTLHNDPFQYRSIPIKYFLKNSVYGSLAIDKVSQKIITFAVENSNYLPASGEIAAYVSFLNSQVAAMSQFVQTAKTFRDTGLVHSSGTIFLVLQLPKAVFGEDMRSLSKDLEEFDRFITGIHQLATGESESPKLLYTSSSDFLYYVQYSVSALPAFLPIFNECLNSAEKIIKVMSALSILRQSQAVDVGVESMIEAAHKQTMSAVETAIKSAAEKVGRPEGTDISGISVKINLSSQYVVKRICQGAKLSFDIRTEQEASVLVQQLPESDSLPEPLKTIADQSNTQMRIDTSINSAADAQILLPRSDGS